MLLFVVVTRTGPKPRHLVPWGKSRWHYPYLESDLHGGQLLSSVTCYEAGIVVRSGTVPEISRRLRKNGYFFFLFFSFFFFFFCAELG